MSGLWECIRICIKCRKETKKSRRESFTAVPPENEGQANLLGSGSRSSQIMNYESARSHSIRAPTSQQSPSHSVLPPNTPKPSPTPSRSSRVAKSLRLSIHQAWPGSSRISISGNSDITDEIRSNRSPASSTPQLLSQLIGTFRNTVEEFVNTVLRPSHNFDDLGCSNAEASIVRNVVLLVGKPDKDAEACKWSDCLSHCSVSLTSPCSQRTCGTTRC